MKKILSVFCTLFFLTLLLSVSFSPISVPEVTSPPVPSNTPTATIVPTSIVIYVVATPTFTPTPLILDEQGLDVCWDYGIAKNASKYVYSWKSLVLKVLENNEFKYVDDPFLVLAVIAKESLGIPNLTSSDGHRSIGLMQINPLHWRPSIAYLSNNYNNVEYGLMILEEASSTYGNIRDGLGAYNCGYTSYDIDNCFDGGGKDYAEIV